MISYSDLLEYISTIEKAPVQNSDIISWFSQHGFQDEINIYPVDVSYEKASAWIVRRKELHIPYVEAKKISNIYVSEHHNECWQRFFICKELMHFFDYENDCAADDRQKVNTLIKELVDWNALDIEAKQETTKADIMAKTRALMCLAPAHMIDELKENNVLEKRTLDEIALFLKIPKIFIEKVFSEDYLIAHTSAKVDMDLSIVK